MEPTPAFYEQADEKPDKTKFRFLFKYLKPHRKLIWQLVLGLVFGSLIQLIFPFLTVITSYSIHYTKLYDIKLILLMILKLLKIFIMIPVFAS